MTARYLPEFEQMIVDRYLAGESAVSIGNSLGKYTTQIMAVIRRNGVEVRKHKGETHPSWKGGRIGKGDGYIGIYAPDHPRADKQGYVFEHTLVMEKMIGRLPEKDEAVHHIDLNKKNNSPDNLYLCDRIEHTKLHRQLDKLLIPLMEKGIVSFDRVKGEYVLNIN
jgi:hypothetical protein